MQGTQPLAVQRRPATSVQDESQDPTSRQDDDPVSTCVEWDAIKMCMQWLFSPSRIGER